jgi:asparagine synthase (glutamine-hydrolysing)
MNRTDERKALPESFALGEPRFRDSSLAKLCRDTGALAAWREALKRGARAAAALADGEFAVALREPDGRVFLAVDRFAVRSLCYRVVGDTLQFASRADELADGASIDPQALFDYLYAHVIPSPRTIFQGVLRLPPGHYALWQGGRLEVAPYWVPEFDDAAPWSLGDAKLEFRQLLRDAVAVQLDGSKPACFLSGGTDSSTVAGMIGEVAGRPAASYSIGFEAEGYDEMEYARIAARHFRTEHHEYYVTPDDLVAAIPMAAAHFDQPFGNSSALPAYYCARVARDDGVTKLLAGDGGDELFGGNSRYATQRVFGWYDEIPSALRKAVLEPFFGLPMVSKTPLLRKGSGYIRHANTPMPDRLQTFNLLERIGVGNVLSDGLLAAVDVTGPQRQQREVWGAARTENLVNRMLAFDWRYTLGESDLPKVRGAAQLAGIDVGFPLLDAGLLAFALRLPPDAKLKGLRLRWFFKEALRGFLPDAIITKKKQGFGLPFGVWATRHAGLHRLAEESLGSLSTRGVVRPEFVKALFAQHLPAHPGYYGEMVWILMMLEQWLQRHAPTYRWAT